MRLNEALESRDNSFNLIRLLAAALVLCSHSVTVVTGDANNEPLRRSLGLTGGSIAVDVFFVISGLLVTASMRRGDSAVDFIVSRLLRIWPGLMAALLLTVGVASACYWRTVHWGDAAAYVVRNAVPYGILRQGVAGIFDGNPAGPGFNASLWTLPVEVRMYRDVFLLWLASLVFMKHRKRALDVMIVGAAGYLAYCHLGTGDRHSIENALYRLEFMFFIGAAALVLARYVRLSWIGCGVAVASTLVATRDPLAFFLCYSVCTWYVVLCLAYLPRGAVLNFNKLGDYSYGVYIYAWPVQQLAIALWPGISPWGHIAVCLPGVLVLSYGSWRWVEAPALRLKKRVVKRA